MIVTSKICKNLGMVSLGYIKGDDPEYIMSSYYYY